MIRSGILGIFAQSPIKPMQEHMEKVYQTVALLADFFEYVLQEQWEKANETHQQIVAVEQDADELKKDIRLHLPNSLFMPIARSDLLGLLTVQDKIASRSKHISSVVYGRKMSLPSTIVEDYMAFLQRAIDSTKQARKLINELDELIETGFRGREAKRAEDMVLVLDQIERDTDSMQVALREQLFQIEKQLDPIDVIFLYKIIDWTGDLADRAQHVGHRLDSILAN